MEEGRRVHARDDLLTDFAFAGGETMKASIAA